LRILIDYRPALRQRTGVGQYVHELASAVQAQLPPSDTLVLFSSSWKDRLPRGMVPGAAQIDWPIPVQALDLAWHRFEWPPVETLAGEVDIAHSTHPLLMPARHAVRVITIYDLDFLDHPERTRAEIRRDYPVLAARHARRADLIVVISDHTARMVGTRFGVGEDRIVICRPGAPAWPPRDEPTTTGPILFVGTIEPRKNLPALFSAYERVVHAHPDAPRLVLAGKTVEQSPTILDALKSRPALSGRVRQLGYVTDDERLALYRDASILVLPSLEEGFGMTAVEAMQVGVPVIASNRGALPEVVGDAGILIDPTDDEQISKAIADVLMDSGRRRAYAEAGRRRAGQFTWSASAERLVKAYREAVMRRRSRDTR